MPHSPFHPSFNPPRGELQGVSLLLLLPLLHTKGLLLLTPVLSILDCISSLGDERVEGAHVGFPIFLHLDQHLTFELCAGGSPHFRATVRTLDPSNNLSLLYALELRDIINLLHSVVLTLMTFEYSDDFVLLSLSVLRTLRCQMITGHEFISHRLCSRQRLAGLFKIFHIMFIG